MHKNITHNAASVNKTPNSVSQPNVPTQNRYIQHNTKSNNPLWFHITLAALRHMSSIFWSILDSFTLSPPCYITCLKRLLEFISSLNSKKIKILSD